MTSRERVLAVLNGDLPDRVPIWCWGVHPWLTGLHLTVQPVVDAYLERGDTLHWWSPGSGVFLTASDAVTVSAQTLPGTRAGFVDHVVTFHTPSGELTEVNYISTEGKPGYRKKHLLESEGDARRLLSIPWVPPRPDCSAFFELDRELGDRGLVMVSTGSDPLYWVNNLIGSEVFAIWSLDNRDLVATLIAEFARRLADWVGWLLSQGVGPLFGYVGPELCIPPLQSPRDFEEWVVGPDAEINGMIRDAGGYPLVHCHGRVGAVLEGFVRMGAAALHPIEPPPMGDVTLPEAKGRVGDDLCIVGNIQHHDICTLPTSQFRELVRRTVAEGKPGGRFILSPTATPFGWPTMTDLQRENWLALLEVGLEEGRY